MIELTLLPPIPPKKKPLTSSSYVGFKGRHLVKIQEGKIKK